MLVREAAQGLQREYCTTMRMAGGKEMESSTVHEEIVHVMNQLAQGQIPPLKVARCAAVRWALARSKGNVSQAAHMLGISRGTIYRYVRL